MAGNDDQAPQFSTAEYAPQMSGMTCGACRQQIGGTYFQIRGAPVCAKCTEQIRAKTPVASHAAFVRAVIFGFGGALVGFALYVGFELGTGLISGLVSLAVGFIVGKAMNLGSRGVGGRRYQIVAVALTYFAVSMSAVPIAIHQVRQHQSQVQSTAAASQPATDYPAGHESFGKIISTLTLVGLASPFLELRDPTHGIIGLVILFVGLRFAWRFTADRSVQIAGPYTPAAASVPGMN